ncbi:hypothetical protein AVEN_46537-1, partial [Araneus ventricosus]
MGCGLARIIGPLQHLSPKRYHNHPSKETNRLRPTIFAVKEEYLDRPGPTIFAVKEKFLDRPRPTIFAFKEN